MHSKSQVKRIFEQDRPMRLAFNDFYNVNTETRKNVNMLTPMAIFEAGYVAALEHRKLTYNVKTYYDHVVCAWKEWTDRYGKNWKPDVETAYASGWEAGKRLI